MARFLFYDDKLINLLQQDEKPCGGSSVQTYGWIRGLIEEGQDVYIMTNRVTNHLLKEECSQFKLVPLFDPNKGIRWLRWLYYRLPDTYKKIKTVKPDYLYAGIPGWTSVLIGIICRMLKIRFIQRISSDIQLDERFRKEHGAIHQFFLGWGLRLSHHILCQNNYQLEIIQKRFPGKSAIKIFNPLYVKNNEPVEHFASKNYIAWLGVYRSPKNLGLLYEIAALLSKEQFLIAGKEAAKCDEETCYYLEKLKHLSNVHFCGYLQREQVLPYLANASFLLNTSRFEGFSNTFLEALSVGTPIISTRNVNPDSIISNYQLGIIYNDVFDLCTQYYGITSELYQRMVHNAREYVASNHGYRLLAQKLLGFLAGTHKIPKIHILFFIGSFKGGGKERRLIELLSYLAGTNRYELMVVVTDPVIDYPSFYNLNITYRIIPKKWRRNDFTVFYKFYKICKQFKPRLIHTWGRIQSFYALPAVLRLGIPLINGQITSAPPHANKWSLKKIVDRINFKFSDVILSNSQAGIDAYKPPLRKIKIIHNGINPDRFENLPAPAQVKLKYGITTPFVVVMVATISSNKNYSLFFRIAEQITRIRNDISFIAVGGNCEDRPVFEPLYEPVDPNPNIIVTGRIHDVEALVNCCTIGVLFSNTNVHGEGISNSIIEYMSLGKPVIANDAGGTKEIVLHNVNGYLVTNETENEIIQLILGLIDDPQKCEAFGMAGRKMIEESFSLAHMGKAFEQTYDLVCGCSCYKTTNEKLQTTNLKLQTTKL